MATIKLPGLIDPHVHLRDPGQTEKEDFNTGTSAALTGGYTTVIDMPNNLKPIMTFEALKEKIKIAREKIVCDTGFYFGSTGDNLEEFHKVKEKVIGLKLYLNQTTGNYLLNASYLEKIFVSWPNTSPILFHAENETFDLVLNVLKKHPRPIHLCHMSTSYELKKVMKAKEMGLPVTCGVTPHHLFLTKKDITHLKGFGMMKPPLQSREDVDYLWKNLQAIDCIESDHAPHTKKEKLSDNPPFGVSGLETTLPLLLNAISEGKLRIEDVIRLCHDGPKRIFLPHYNNIYHHSSIEVDMGEEYEIKNENLFTKCKWSPFNGWKVKGKVKKVFLRGEKVFDGEKILAQPGFGNICFSK